MDDVTLDRISAQFGLDHKQKGVLKFVVDPDGPDSVYTLEFKSQSVPEVREILSQAGIDYRSIRDENGKITAIIVDEGGKHTDGIRALVDADAVRGTTEHRGRSQLIGSWDDREEGRKIYEQILKDNPRRVGGTDEAQGHLPGAETTGRRGLDEPPAFDAGDGQALRGRPSETQGRRAGNPAQPPAPVQAGVTDPDPAIASQAAAKAKARKAARQASRDDGQCQPVVWV